MKRSLTSHIWDLITIYLLGKELADWDATPCFKNHGWILTVSSVRNKSKKAFWKITLPKIGYINNIYWQ